jgi:hypothetical protein
MHATCPVLLILLVLIILIYNTTVCLQLMPLYNPLEPLVS